MTMPPQSERLVILIILRILREKIKVSVQQPPMPCQPRWSYGDIFKTFQKVQFRILKTFQKVQFRILKTFQKVQFRTQKTFQKVQFRIQKTFQKVQFDVCN
jgi:hypothetical protein